MSHSTVAGAGDSASGSEAVGFALRIGVPLGSVWGVEAEFSAAGETEGGLTSSALARAAGGGYLTSVDSGLTLPYGIDISQREQRSAFSTLVWARQQLTGRSALVYLGGASFGRTASTVEISYNFLRFPTIPGISLPIPILPPSERIDSVFYSVRPIVGVEGRIGLTDRVELVPGIRLTGLESGLLIRPSVGIGWSF